MFEKLHIRVLSLSILFLAVFARGEEVILTEVFGYSGAHGCSPTSGVEIMGYWDCYGYPDLIPGSSDWSMNQERIEEAIASKGDGDGTKNNPGTPGTGHVPDYEYFRGVCDRDFIFPDMSSINPLGAHTDNCMADFMGTSRSQLLMRHGATPPGSILPGMMIYAIWRNPSYSFVGETIGSIDSTLWSRFVHEIRFGRPVSLLVDRNGDSLTDHSATAIGYKQEGTTKKYYTVAIDNPPQPHEWHRGTWPGIPWGVAQMDTLKPAGTSDTAWIATDGDWADENNWDNGLPTVQAFVYIPEGSVPCVSGACVSCAANFVNNIGEARFEYGSLSTEQFRNVGKITGYGTLTSNLENFGTITADMDTLTIVGQISGEGSVQVNPGAELRLQVSGAATIGTAYNDGTITQDGPILLTSPGDEYVGYSSNGAFMQTDGDHTTNGNLYLGYGSGSVGTYELSGGQLSIIKNEYIGYEGQGRFVHTGGSHTVTAGSWSRLTLGFHSSSQAVYELSGTGELLVDALDMTWSSNGSLFRQTGGKNTVEALLTIVNDATYELHAGELSTFDEYIEGLFIQTGGTHVADFGLRIRAYVDSKGTYEMSGGQFSTPVVEIFCDGGFKHTGGTIIVSEWFGCGAGTYELSGEGKLSTKGSHWGRSYRGPGQFTQTGGINNIDDALYLGEGSRCNGIYELSGGILSVEAIHVAVDGGTGNFNWTGGTLETDVININTDGTMTVEQDWSYDGELNINGGSLVMGLNELIVGTGGILTGDGTIIGNVTNSGGTVSIGSSAGILTIDGNYSQQLTGILEIELTGTDNSDPNNPQYDQLVITGGVFLDGTLNIILADGFAPSLDDTFDILNFNSAQLIGAFRTINLPALSEGLRWNISSLYTTGEIRVVYEALQVEIDIKPGSYPNVINLGLQGVIPVAILSSDEFNATQVDPSSVTLSGAGVAVRGKGNNTLAHIEDVNGDGRDDLLLQVETENLSASAFQDGFALLEGQTFDGVLIEGWDEIIIVPPDQDDADESITVEEAAAFMLLKAGETINRLDADNFSNEESATALANEIDDVLAMLDEGLFTEALDILENDILERTNGCANSGEPDENDWITTYDGQGEVYPLVMEVIEFLESFI